MAPWQTSCQNSQRTIAFVSLASFILHPLPKRSPSSRPPCAISSTAPLLIMPQHSLLKNLLSSPSLHNPLPPHLRSAPMAVHPRAVPLNRNLSLPYPSERTVVLPPVPRPSQTYAVQLQRLVFYHLRCQASTKRI